MNEIIEQINAAARQFSPNLLGALAVFVAGWIIALIAAAVTRRLLRRTQFDNRLAHWIAGQDAPANLPVEVWAGKVVFYAIMLLVLIAFFYALRLPVLADPLNVIVTSIAAYLPRLLAAGLLVLVAWVVATVSKRVIAGVARGFNLDERLGNAVGGEAKAKTSLSQTLSEVVYWLVFLFFLPAILGTLEIKSLLDRSQRCLASSSRICRRSSVRA
jgi:hypothetical protein